MAFYITYNGTTSTKMGVNITQRPNIPVAERDTEEVEISGKDGSYIVDNGRYKPVEIEIEMNFDTSPTNWASKLAEITEWLLYDDSVDEDDGYYWLQFSDDDTYERRVLKVTIDTVERAVKRTGTFVVTFLCDPYRYLISGQEWQSLIWASSDSNVVMTLTNSSSNTGTINSATLDDGEYYMLINDEIVFKATDGTAILFDEEEFYKSNSENAVSVTKSFIDDFSVRFLDSDEIGGIVRIDSGLSKYATYKVSGGYEVENPSIFFSDTSGEFYCVENPDENELTVRFTSLSSSVGYIELELYGTDCVKYNGSTEETLVSSWTITGATTITFDTSEYSHYILVPSVIALSV